MQSLKNIYKIGRGPSSSHTMGPAFAADVMQKAYPEADSFTVVLYGSLALTGKGHGTDRVLKETFAPKPCEVVFDADAACSVHPNTMDIVAKSGDAVLGRKRAYSVGGGSVIFEGETEKPEEEVYPLKTYTEISDYCKRNNLRIWQYVAQCEGEEIFGYLERVWAQMRETIHDGLTISGVLPGCLKTQRRAQLLYNQKHIDESAQTKENRLVCAYAFATSEQNAAGGTVVTAPTCGSCGVVPSVLKYMQETRHFTDEEVLHALATGGLVGNVIKKNASVSGAECGCQAEIGSACSMAAAALGELFGLGLDQIEYAAEVAMEHHLGLTCDPIAGLVQIPCIERNAVAAMRAINALSLANFLTASAKIHFDVVVKAMYNTGKDLNSNYRETSSGGLARYYPIEKLK